MSSRLFGAVIAGFSILSMDVNALDSRSQGDDLAKTPPDLASTRLFFLISLALSAAALPQLFERGKFSGNDFGSYSIQWAALLALVIALVLVELAIFLALFSGGQVALARLTGKLHARLVALGWANAAGIAALWVGYVLVALLFFHKHFADPFPQLWLFWLTAGLGAFLWMAAWKKFSFFPALLFSAIIYGAGVKALGYLPEVNSYPFSLAWSEASRYYYASLPYSKALYGFQIPLSFLHPSRYLLQSMAYWLPGAGLWFHRFWQVFLWLSFSLAAGLVLARHWKISGRARVIGLTIWAGLFLLQGPVYYHLLVCVILVLAGFDVNRFWRTLVFVVLASAWAGISRVNWMPVPAMIAASLYLLEKPVCEGQVRNRWAAWWRYLWPPLAWAGTGMLAALASQAAYVVVSGSEDISGFGSSFTSSLLLYRLLPSPTFPSGVLPAALLLSAPLLLLAAGTWLAYRSEWHWLRVLGLTAMAVVLFVGGLVVSTKIGGGSNAHNMDAFEVLLLVISGGIGLKKFATESGTAARAWRPWALTLAIVLLPVFWNLNVGDPFMTRNFAQADYDLAKLNAIVQEYTPKGEVLFITQRQLVIFNLVPGVPLVPDYELMVLTEMSISNNQPYFDRFNADLRSHRFALIVANQQLTVLKDPAENAFAEENNAWVKYVAVPLNTYYQEKIFFETQGVQLLVPRGSP